MKKSFGMKTDLIKNRIHSMTLKEKIAFCSGKNFWETKGMRKYHIPSVFMCDGPHGLRRQDIKKGNDMLGVHQSRPSTCFPAAVTTASSWDPGLLEKIGEAIGREAKCYGVSLVLGPGANIKRNPLCGRNFEYFSEDPYLAGKMAAGFIRGIEKEGIGSSLKHFACNNQELSRFNSDSVMDERTLREIYLTPFEIAVKEGHPSTVMCAYNKVNGVHCSDSRKLLTDILRGEWGFDGFVVTDWGAMNDRIKAFQAGCDLNMPGGSHYMEKAVLKAVEEGRLSPDNIDESVERLLKFILARSGPQKRSFGPGRSACRKPAPSRMAPGGGSRKEKHSLAARHHRLAALAAAQGAVLLKNDGLLPLKENQTLAVVGHMARQIRYQGSGSSHIQPTKLEQPVDYLKNAVFSQGCDVYGNTTPKLIRQAQTAAKAADAAVVFAGLPESYESEGFDRENMKMPEGQILMIRAVAKANPNTVVVLFCGSPVECPWADQVKAVLYMGLPGQAGARAVADLIYGRINPGGKLAETWPIRYKDCASAGFYGKEKDACYREGIYVGYRYYDKAGVQVQWPFGYGLSYTTFAYSDLSVEGLKVKATVTNTGSVQGSEVVQLYMAPVADGTPGATKKGAEPLRCPEKTLRETCESLHRPEKELKGFQKIFLNPGEQKTVTFELTGRSFALWDKGWKIPEGDYRIMVGGSSADLPLSAAVTLSPGSGEMTIPVEPVPGPDWQKESWYEKCQGRVGEKDWEMLLGRAYKPEVLKKGRFTKDHSLEEMKDFSLIIKLIYKAVIVFMKLRYKSHHGEKDPQLRMMIASSVGSPLRNMEIFSKLPGWVFTGLLRIANGRQGK